MGQNREEPLTVEQLEARYPAVDFDALERYIRDAYDAARDAGHEYSGANPWRTDTALAAGDAAADLETTMRMIERLLDQHRVNVEDLPVSWQRMYAAAWDTAERLAHRASRWLDRW